MRARLTRFAAAPLLGLVFLVQPLAQQAYAYQPDPPDKNQTAPAQASQAPADSGAVDPTGTKNDPLVRAATLAGATEGVTRFYTPEAGSKNAGPANASAGSDRAAASAAAPAALASIMAGPDLVLTCGAYGNANWTTTSGTFQAIRQCTLTVPAAGYVFLAADGNTVRADGPYEANFEFGIDSMTGDPSVDRWVNVYDDATDGTDKSVALSALKPITAGTHTFYLLGRRFAGTGTVLVYDPTLTVVFIPATAVNVQVCGVSTNLNWTTTSNTFQVVRQCSLNAPSAGLAFIATDTSLARQDGEYEALFEIGVDSTAGNPNIDRWINVYNDPGDGTDETMRISVFQPVAAGNHTFYSLARRYAGQAPSFSTILRSV